MKERILSGIARIDDFFSSKIKMLKPKAIIMVKVEKKRDERPNINFLGKVSRKSSCAYREARIPRKISTEVLAENNDNAFAIEKAKNGS